MSVISLEVAALFAIEDQATATLGLIAESMERAGNVAETLKAKLSDLGQVSLAGVNEGLTAMAETLARASTAAAGVKDAAETAASAAGSSARAAAASVDEVTAAYGRALEAQERFRQAASAPVVLGGGGIGAYGGGALSRGGRGVANAYPGDDGIIDGQFAEAPLMLGYDMQREAAEDVAEGYSVPMVMGQGFGRGGRGTRSAGPGGSANAYTESEESGPAIHLGPRPHDESLDIPVPPGGYWPPGGGGSGRRGGDDGDGASGGGRRRGGLHFGVTQMLEGATIYDAVHQGMSEDASIRAAMMRGFHLNPNDPANADVAQQLRDAAHNAVQGTSFDESEAAGGLATLAAPLGARGRAGVQQFLPVFQSAARIAEAAKQLGIGSYEDTLAASVEYAHQTGVYDPKQLTSSLNDLFAITEAMPGHTSIYEQARVMSYVAPEARALGIDPTEAAQAAGFLERSGIRGTKAATTLRQMILGSLRGFEHEDPHIQHQRQNLEHDLALSPDGRRVLRTSQHGPAAVQALHELGLTDDHGRSTVLNKQTGGLDLDAMLQRITDAATHAREAHNLAGFGADMFHAFGVRGEDANLLAENPVLFRDFVHDVSPQSARNPNGTLPAEQQLLQTSGGAQQTLGQAGARANDVLNTLGTSILPAVTAGFHGLADVLSGLNNELRGHEHVSQGLAVGGIAAAGATLVEGGLGFLTGGARQGLRRAVTWPARYARALFGGGGTEAAAGAAEVAEADAGLEAAGAGAGLLGLLGIGPAVAGGSVAALGFGAGALANRVDKQHPWLAAMDNALYSALDHLNPFTGNSGGAPAASIAAQAAEGTAAAGGVVNHISIGPITITGVGTDIHMMVDKLFHDMAEKLGTSLTHASGFGQGSLSSPFAIAPGF